MPADNVPLNWMKDLPWNKSKTVRLQEQLDSQLMNILRKRLKGMGITVQQQQQQQQSSTAPKCPVPGMSAAATATRTISSSSSTSSTPSECPFQEAAVANGSSSSSGNERITAPAASAATTEQMMLDSKDILTLAVKLSQQDGAIDLEMLLSQMKTFFAGEWRLSEPLGGLQCLNAACSRRLISGPGCISSRSNMFEATALYIRGVLVYGKVTATRGFCSIYVGMQLLQ